MGLGHGGGSQLFLCLWGYSVGREGHGGRGGGGLGVVQQGGVWGVKGIHIGLLVQPPRILMGNIEHNIW